MKKILINYAILLSAIVLVSLLILNQPASTILKSVMYLSIPMMVAFGTIYTLIEHVVGQSKQQGKNKTRMMRLI